MKTFLSAFLVALATLASAQRFTLRGQLTDTLSSPLPSATIMLIQPSDSSLVSFGVSDARGLFEIRNVNLQELLFRVSFVGYETCLQAIAPLPGQTEMDLGQIKLQHKSTQLKEVIVRAEAAPVMIKKDTIEFHAGSFKTKANANVEDLLKKMPGIDVENDGTIRAQGEPVQRVTVDGKEFFGRDPKLATRNLPADAVDKVQVFDRKSDQSQFTGIDDGQREKSINLELKEEKRNGAFGTLIAGAGAGIEKDERFLVRGNINRFSKGKQVSVLGMGNNINEQGFSIADYMNFTGGSQQMMGGGGGAGMAIQIGGDNASGIALNFGGRQNGVLTNYAGGLNFNDSYKGKTDLHASYFYNQLDQHVDRSINRINYFPTGDYYFNQFSRQTNQSKNQRLNFTIDHRIDSANSLRFSASASQTNTRLVNSGTSETINPDRSLQNTSQGSNLTEGGGISVNSSLLFRHRFEKKGRSFSTNVIFNVSQNESNGQLDAENEFFSGLQEKETILQRNDQVSDNQTLGTTTSYIEPLGGRKYLELSYIFRTNRNEISRDVFDVASGLESVNDALTSRYRSDYFYHRPGISARMNRPKFNVSAGLAWQQTNLQGDLQSPFTGTEINRRFGNILPVFRFNYDFSTFKHLRFDYETSMQELTIQQLQPVVDNITNQINQSTGNPELAPAYNHRTTIHFALFEPGKSINLFGLINGTFINNAISYSRIVFPNLSTLTQPINVAGSYNLNGNFNFGFPVRKIHSRFSLGPAATLQENRVLLNDVENVIHQQTLGGTARYTLTYKEIFTLDLSTNLSNHQTWYESAAAPSAQDQTYFNKTYSAESNVTVLKNYQVNGTFDYLVYDSKTTGFNQAIPLLGISISRFLLEAQSGELKVGVVNLLNRSLSVAQQMNVNYMEQVTYNNLGRYWMISFTYALNKQLNPMSPRRGPGGGMRMMIRQGE